MIDPSAATNGEGITEVFSLTIQILELVLRISTKILILVLLYSTLFILGTGTNTARRTVL
jgi:hypothetical protein